MKLRLLVIGCMAVMATGVVLTAQSTGFLDPEYRNRAQTVADDDAQGHWELARWAFQNDLYGECQAECRKLRSLDEGDLRAEYLAAASEFYRTGTYAMPDETDVTTRPPYDPTAPDGADEPIDVTERSQPPEAAEPVVVQLTGDEVDQVYQQYGEQVMQQFRNTVQPMLVRQCATPNCHGDPDRGGRFYLQRQGTNRREVIAENMVAVSRFIDTTDLSRSDLLRYAIAPAEAHPQGPVLGNEQNPAYRTLKDWVDTLPTAGEMLWESP